MCSWLIEIIINILQPQILGYICAIQGRRKKKHLGLGTKGQQIFLQETDKYVKA